MRGWVWMEISGAAAKQAKMDKEYYRLMVQRGEEGSQVDKQIELVRSDDWPWLLSAAVDRSPTTVECLQLMLVGG